MKKKVIKVNLVTRILLIVVGLSILNAGCGQKGKLHLASDGSKKQLESQ